MVRATGSVTVVAPWAPRAPMAAASGAAPAGASDSVALAGEPVSDNPTAVPRWKRFAMAGLVGLNATAALSGAATVLMPASVSAMTRVDVELAPPSDSRLQAVVAPTPARGRRRRAAGGVLASPLPLSRPATTVEEARARLRHETFPALDPFVASVASTVWSAQHAAQDTTIVPLALPGHFSGELPAEVGLQNGTDAPMLLILPGLGADARASHVRAFKQMALDRGMNYTVLPNPWSMDWQGGKPLHDPGNLAVEAAAVRDALSALKARYPAHYAHISVAGYSYGAALGAAVLAQDAATPLINGSLVAVSPPVQMMDSMARLDNLRNEYGSSLDWIDVAADYGKIVSEYGFERITQSPLGSRRAVDTEKFLADNIGSRDALRKLVEHVDRSRGHNRLPLHAEEARNGPVRDTQRHMDLAEEQSWALDDATYAGYVADYLARDPAFATASPREMAEAFRYTRLVEKARVPVMTLASADDYILDPANVAELRRLESSPAPNQVTHVFDRGGHVGLMLHPQVREQMMDFLAQPPWPAAAEGRTAPAAQGRP